LAEIGRDKTRRWKAVRVDYVVVSNEEWWYGIMGWTGNSQYMRMLRQLAPKKELALNSHRLWDIRQVSECDAKSFLFFFQTLSTSNSLSWSIIYSSFAKL
jgi:DNA polymerase/3'-5' exonuclease PolX